MNKRATTPAGEEASLEQARQETLIALNSDPRVLASMNDHLVEQVTMLRARLRMLMAENEDLKSRVPPKPPKAKKKTQPRGGRGTGSPDQTS